MLAKIEFPEGLRDECSMLLALLREENERRRLERELAIAKGEPFFRFFSAAEATVCLQKTALGAWAKQTAKRITFEQYVALEGFLDSVEDCPLVNAPKWLREEFYGKKLADGVTV